MIHRFSRSAMLLCVLCMAAELIAPALHTTPLLGTATGHRSFKPKGTAVDTNIHHYEYVLPDGWICVYDIDNGHQFVESLRVPTTRGVRGFSVNPAAAKMYISYGGDGGVNGNGSLLEYDLHQDSVTWTKDYPHGIDSHAMTPDGTTIFMPSGELTNDGKWYVVNTSDGSEKGVISTHGFGPHNTFVSFDGANVYMGDRDVGSIGHDSFYVASTTTYQLTKSIGSFLSGVRPFTVNGSQTFGFVTITGLLGFQVCSISTGQVSYTLDLTTMGFSKTTCGSHCETAPSHGISVSPDETEVYVIDSPNSYVHVFDVTGLSQNKTPVKIADIKLQHVLGTFKNNCVYDCQRGGWLHHSLDGRYVYVGDAGDVIETATHSIVSFLPALNNSRMMLEIDWQNGNPIATSNRVGAGYLPSSPALVSPGNDSIVHAVSQVMTWNPAFSATSYHVQVATDSLFSVIVLDDSTVTDTSKELALSDSTTYYWHVSSKNGYGSGPWSSARVFTAYPEPLPIQLAGFTGRTLEDGRVGLEWTTISEVNNYGFLVERKPTEAASYRIISGLIPGKGTTLEQSSYSWTDSNASTGVYLYRLKQIDLNGSFSYSNEIKVVVSGVTGVPGKEAFPTTYALDANYPNPFNPVTRIRYALPAQSKVVLQVYNLLGQIVVTLVDGVEDAGFKLVTWNAETAASGIYFYRLQAEDVNNPEIQFSQMLKMVLIR